MSLNPESEGIVSFRHPSNGTEAPVLEPPAAAPPAFPLPAYPGAQPWEAQPLEAPAPFAPARARRRPGWLAPVSIGLIGLIASGALGWLLYSTMGQRDVARHDLASTRATLADTDKQLAARKATDAYVNVYVTDIARVRTEYGNLAVCKTYGECRTAAQQALSDLQDFQADRARIAVPAALANADAMTGDALSAAIAADQEFISGMDNDNLAKIKDGAAKFDAAMLSLAKAESSLGAGL